MRSVFASLVLVIATFVVGTPRAESLGNDLIENAVSIQDAPAVFNFDSSAYNSQSDPADPVVACGGQALGLERQSHTAWFTLTPVTAGAFSASTEGSGNVDTVLALWKASGNAPGAPVDCNHIVQSNELPRPMHSRIPASGDGPPLMLTAGQKYYLEVMSFQATEGGQIQLSVTYTGLLSEHPVPVIDSLSPAGAPVGTNGANVLITGSGFGDGTTVRFGLTDLPPATVSASQLTVNIPANLLATESSINVSVTNPAPGGGTSSTLPFVVYPVPVLVSMEPQNVLVGSGPVVLSSIGTGFREGISRASFAGNARELSVLSPTTAEVALLDGDSASAGQFALVVTNQAGGGQPAASAPLTLLVRTAFDANCSGAVDAADAQHLLRVAAGLSSIQPGCPLGFDDDALLSTVLAIRRAVAGFE